MKMTNNTPVTETIGYRVKVGHLAVDVEGQTKDEVILEARRRLRLEMPRMWDVISSMDDQQLEITPLME